MKATCHACDWTSIIYVRKHAAGIAADKHQRLYHRGQTNIIAIRGGLENEHQ